MTTQTKIRVLRDHAEADDPSGPVAEGTVVEGVYFPSDLETIVQPGEAWYVRPDTGEDWLSLPGDYEVIE